MKAGDRPPSDQQPGFRVELDGDPAFPGLFGFASEHGRRLPSRPNGAEVLVRPALDVVRVDVSHDGGHCIAGAVVLQEVIECLSPREELQIRRVPDHRYAVRVNLEGRGQESRLQDPARTRFQAHAPFLADDIEFGEEPPEDRVLHPVRLQCEPELKPVGREFDEVPGRFVRCRRVQAAGAFGGEDAVEFVRDGVDSRPVLQR